MSARVATAELQSFAYSIEEIKTSRAEEETSSEEHNEEIGFSEHERYSRDEG